MAMEMVPLEHTPPSHAPVDQEKATSDALLQPPTAQAAFTKPTPRSITPEDWKNHCQYVSIAKKALADVHQESLDAATTFKKGWQQILFNVAPFTIIGALPALITCLVRYAEHRKKIEPERKMAAIAVHRAIDRFKIDDDLVKVKKFRDDFRGAQSILRELAKGSGLMSKAILTEIDAISLEDLPSALKNLTSCIERLKKGVSREKQDAISRISLPKIEDLPSGFQPEKTTPTPSDVGKAVAAGISVLPQVP